MGVERQNHDRAALRDSLAELGELTETAGGEVVDTGIQKMESLSPATFIGEGSTIGGNVFIMDSVAPHSLVIYDGLDMRVLNKSDLKKKKAVDFQI